jgi:hypothetical protein
MMSKTRREFAPEFKREAVALLESSSRPLVGRGDNTVWPIPSGSRVAKRETQARIGPDAHGARRAKKAIGIFAEAPR